MKVQDVVDEFHEWNRLVEKAINTQKYYRCRLKRFVNQFGEREFSSLTPLEVQKHLLKAGEGFAPDTKRGNVIAYESLQNWAYRQELIPEKVCKEKIEKPASRMREDLPTDEEMSQLMAVADYDFLIIYSALRQCGARPGELCGALIERIDRKQNMIVIPHHKTVRKTQRPRLIPIGDNMARLLSHTIGERESGHIFLKANGDPWTGNSLTKAFARYRDVAGIRKNLCLYMTRHWHATKLCKLVNLKAASMALNHSNTKMTEKYVHPEMKELRANQDLVA